MKALAESGRPFGGLRLARVVNALFSALAVLAVGALTARLVPGRRRAPVIAAAVAGLIPAYGFVAGFAYNDGLALAAASGLLAVSLAVHQDGGSRRRLAAGGRCSPPPPRWPACRRCRPCSPPPCCAPPAGAGATGSCPSPPPRWRPAGSTSATPRATAIRPAAATCSTCSIARGARRWCGVAADPTFWSGHHGRRLGPLRRPAGAARAAARRGRHGVPGLAGAAHADHPVAGAEPATPCWWWRPWCGSTPPAAARTGATCTRCSLVAGAAVGATAAGLRVASAVGCGRARRRRA